MGQSFSREVVSVKTREIRQSKYGCSEHNLFDRDLACSLCGSFGALLKNWKARSLERIGGIAVTEEKLAIMKTAPAIAGATIYGLTLQDWVAVVTMFYVALQAGLLLPKYWRLFRDWHNGKKS